MGAGGQPEHRGTSEPADGAAPSSVPAHCARSGGEVAADRREPSGRRRRAARRAGGDGLSDACGGGPARGRSGGDRVRAPDPGGLFCGLRPTEYLGLRWRDLDLERGQQVRGFRFGPTKTHRSRRPVSMPEELVQRLRLWRSVQSAHRLHVGEVWVDLDLVFTNAVGLPHSEETVRDRFHRVLEAAGLQRVRLYDLRHTMATLILNDTKDIKLVASRLGHSNEYLVLRRYGHLVPGSIRQQRRGSASSFGRRGRRRTALART